MKSFFKVFQSFSGFLTFNSDEGDPMIGPGPDFLVLKSTVLGGLSFSGFLTKTEPSPIGASKP